MGNDIFNEICSDFESVSYHIHIQKEETTKPQVTHTIIKVRRPASGPADGLRYVYTVGHCTHKTTLSILISFSCHAGCALDAIQKLKIP